VAFDVADIRKVLDAFEKSSCTEITLRSSDCELIIAAEGGEPGAASLVAASTSEAAIDLSDKQAVPGEAARPHPPEPGPPEPGPPEPGPPEPGPSGPLEPAGETVPVAAPSVGIFWRSPQPGAPPFVEVGDSVTADTTTCIVEVMKLMNHVKAGAAGRVVQVHPRNGEQVTAGQPLFTIEVSG
jgi:acetyl-CoA carboxylase biotin carboxyl carrier protein